MVRAGTKNDGMKKRLVVGLTGSFGSGKSTAGRMLKQLGARKVIDADRLAHEVFRTGHPVGRSLRKLLGIKGKLSRQAIAGQVFSSLSKRRKLEALVHPYVYQRIRSELSKVQSGVVVLEVPLLFETGFNRLCDVTVAILAGEKQILKRLRKSGYAPHEVQARLQAQLPSREKKKRADLYILNSSSKNLLMKKTKRVWFKLKSLLN